MRSHRTIWIRTAICLAALTGGAASAQFQPLPSSRPAAPAPLPATDPALAAAEQAFSLLDEASRRAVLEALMWSGDYNGVVGINFGKRGYDGIRAFQKKKNLPQTGILDDMQRQMLLAEGRRLRDSVRFSVITDASSGMKIGIPLRVTEKK
ncbi:MAG: peptidoglycan-binding domain-containing protein, partial [Beijerinckiaceae bacterium]